MKFLHISPGGAIRPRAHPRPQPFKKIYKSPRIKDLPLPNRESARLTAHIISSAIRAPLPKVDCHAIKASGSHPVWHHRRYGANPHTAPGKFHQPRQKVLVLTNKFCLIISTS
jgi:hypothetical protein